MRGHLSPSPDDAEAQERLSPLLAERMGVANPLPDESLPQHQYVAHAGDPVELLFDLESDPGTTRNLAADPAYPPVLRQHRDLLRG
jgi:hypothetical protein